MKLLLLLGSAITALSSLVVGWNFVFPPQEITVGQELVASAFPKKTLEERMVEARERSKQAKGLYMTADVANDQGAAGTHLRKNLIRLADETEINALVIDVKEVCGPDYSETSLKKLLVVLKEKNIWAVARIVVAKDSSRIYINPEWYLKRNTAKYTGDECIHKKHLRLKSSGGEVSTQNLWQDKRGGYWVDPAHPGVREYLLEFSKKMADLGFDEIQYDYIRFPSDGDVQNIIYPAWTGKPSRCVVMEDLFGFLTSNLKKHKPELILSADFFGYASIGIDTGIGQCIENIKDHFDYVSFIVYPSHYYSGLKLPAVPEFQLPEINFSSHQVRTNPDVVVERSLRFARDYFDGKIDLFVSAGALKVIATTTVALTPRSSVCLRPWLEDFYHEEDKAAARPFGVQKVKMQIGAAERADKCGWLLWNAANVYTEGALKKQ